jgi:3-oxoacyl-[acyl-carrier-protein] synthase II
MAERPSISVTGMSWITALGDDLDGVWQALLAGQTGFKPVAHPGKLRNNLAAAAMDQEIPPAERLTQLTCRALTKALAAAGRKASDPDVQLVLGTSLAAFLDDAPSRQSLSGWARAVAKEIGAANPPVVLSTACSAGSDAIVAGAELLRAGQTKCCVCGGADVLSWAKRIAHSTLGTMSPTVLRAFDLRHDGTLLGEGAGFLVLETSPNGRKPLAKLLGTGSANDATGMTVADTTGLSAKYAMTRSLADAGLTSDAIGLINAHGSGTPMNDLTEKSAFQLLFSGSHKPIVFGTKGNFGHSLGATGTIEAIALILALQKGQVPPVYGLEQPDPEFPLPLPRQSAISWDARIGLSLTLGFGGFDTSLIFEVTR